METFKIQVTKTARYFQSAPINGETKKVWIVLHGYGMHAGIFLKKFEPLFDGKTVFIAPEALNRYYVKGSSGNVGASWMTKEERLDEIHDYVNYLENLVASLNLLPSVELGFLGFSQGAATLARWFDATKFNPSKVIFYAGIFPPDLNLPFTSEKWKSPQIIVLLGNRDEFYRFTDFTQSFAPLKNINPHTLFTEFDGGHEIIPQVLRIYFN